VPETGYLGQHARKPWSHYSCNEIRREAETSALAGLGLLTASWPMSSQFVAPNFGRRTGNGYRSYYFIAFWFIVTLKFVGSPQACVLTTSELKVLGVVTIVVGVVLLFRQRSSLDGKVTLTEDHDVLRRS
jgi:hypothetical protein